MGVYLDFNSSSPIDKRILNKMINVYQTVIGNADSRTHYFGENARSVVETARNEVAVLLEVNKDEVFFTSGATESNNIVFQGLKDYSDKTGKKHIITTSIEHKAVLETCKFLERLGFEVDYVDPKEDGRVSCGEVVNRVREDTLIVSVMHVNNETGIIQPVEEIGNFLAEKEVYFHIDATQSFGKLVKELKKIKYDMLSMSAHKIGGPQGVGALILRKRRYKFPPIKGIMYGGQQERGIRPGTIPVALVAGLGFACSLVSEEYEINFKRCLQIKKKLLAELQGADLSYRINGEQSYCIPNTLNICFEGVSSEALMISTKQYCGISNGSACNSRSYEPSYVLAAMGFPIERIESSIRVSWGFQSDLGEVLGSFKELLLVAKKLAF